MINNSTLTYDSIINNVINGHASQSILFIKNALDDAYEFDFFIKKLLCLNCTACDNCKSCTLFNNNTHPDLHKLQGHAKDNIKIDSIRNIQENAHLSKHTSNKKIYIIENAQFLTLSAANALLKILEEPPPGIMFILTTNNKSLMLPTITSRCLEYNIKTKDTFLLEFIDEHDDLLSIINQKCSILSIAEKWLKTRNLSDNIHILYQIIYSKIKENPCERRYFLFLDEIYKTIKIFIQQPNSNLLLESLLISFTLILNNIYT